MSARNSGTASGATSLLPDEYGDLIERVRETANAMVPRNSTVLVVSRGDDELLRLGPRRALHFPQDEFGRYAGYYPQDSEAAISALENMRARGADYLLLPSTAFWWLDHYKGLREHLDVNYPTIVSGGECMVFELLAAGVQAPAGDADTGNVSAVTSSQRVAGPLDELLRALLPDDADVAVVAATDTDLPLLENCRAVRPPGVGEGLHEVLAAAGEAEFVVIPATAYARVHEDGEPGDSVGSWTLVTRQRYVGEIYERTGTSAVGRRPSADSGPPANGGWRPANGGLWSRFLRFLRRS